MKNILVLILLLVALPLIAQNENTGDNDTLSFEVSCAFFEGIYIARLSYNIWDYGDLSGGFLYRYVDIEEGYYNVYSPVLAYRQYLWKNLHIEFVIYPAYAAFQYPNDSEIFSAFRIWSELLVGYKFDLPIGDFKSFIILQPGIGFSLYKYSEWPVGVMPKGYDSLTFISCY